MDILNEQQQIAASYSGKHLLVLAGAGTGKTRTIIARAKYLIKRGVLPKRILILSFTRKSANEIVHRISNELREDNSALGLTGSTFHAWCMAIIHNHPNIFPQSSYTLLDEDDQKSCINLLCGRRWKIKDKNDRIINPSKIIEVYSYMVNARCSLSAAIRMRIYDNAPETYDVEKERQVIAGIITMYLEYKKQRHYIDYDDILLIVSTYLKRNENLRRSISGLYDHILVDEMQDTNPLQYELLSSFYDNCHLFCVGDDAQSIYGFRGADFDSIHHFTELVKDSEVCKLTINYRSTQEILNISNWLINQSPLQYDKNLVAHRGSGIPPIIKHWSDEWEQAEDVASTIYESNKKMGKLWKDNLVLARSVWGLRKVEACLMKFNIPYVVFGGGGLMQSKHVRDVISPMRIVSNYFDEIAWTRYLQLWNRIGPVTAAEIIGKVTIAANLDDSIEELSNYVREHNLQEEIIHTLKGIKNTQHNPSNAILTAVSNMESLLKNIYKDEWDWRKDDFPIVAEVASSCSTISDFVSEYILDPISKTAWKKGGKEDDSVVLSTIHSAKGLEADCVYLVNASVNSFPTQRAILNGNNAIEEERRCLYVALTRARDYLTIYRDVHSMHTIKDGDCSQYFFNELPSNLYDSEVIAAHFAPIKSEDVEHIEHINYGSLFDFD